MAESYQLNINCYAFSKCHEDLGANCFHISVYKWTLSGLFIDVCILIHILFNILQFSPTGDCYIFEIINMTSLASPNYQVQHQVFKTNNTIGAIVKNLVKITKNFNAKLKIDRISRSYTRVLFNGLVNMCDMSKFKTIKVFESITSFLLSEQSGNFTYRCPLEPGTYVFRNINIPKYSPALKFLYVPKATYVLHCVLTWKIPRNGSLVKLHDFKITGEIQKKC